MSQQQLFRFVTDLLPAWRKTRRRVLALGVQGLIRRRRLTLSGIARGMDSSARAIHRVKRLWRFSNNPAVDPWQAMQALAARAFALRTDERVPVIMDETGLADRAMVLGAAPGAVCLSPLTGLQESARLAGRSAGAHPGRLVPRPAQPLAADRRPRLCQ
jgi:hypothetical protein